MRVSVATDARARTLISAIAFALVLFPPSIRPELFAATSVDARWLSQRGPGPYLLDRAGETYVLNTDVTTSGTAFVIAARNVTFDLDGHVLTYNNAVPLTVPNGGFEADAAGSSSVTGWDTSLAAHSKIRVVANDVYLFGSRILRWTITDGAGAQVIRSSNIVIPQAQRVYTASIATSGLTLKGRSINLKLEVIDALTGGVEQNFARVDSSVWQADAAAFSFIPEKTGPVYLRITAVLDPGSGDVTFNLDRAKVSRSLDYGILAAHVDPSGLAFEHGNHASGGRYVSAIENIPAAEQIIYRNVYAPTIRDTLGTGRICQGNAEGASCHAINVQDTGGTVTINGVAVEVRGDDTIPIQARRTYANALPGDARAITNCTITWPELGPNVTRRSSLYPSIDATGITPAVVRGCTIERNPQVGIRVGGANKGALHIVSKNRIRPRVIATNGYAILALGRGVQIVDNTIDTGDSGSSMGIGLNGDLADVTVAGNKVDVRFMPNREYGTSVPARAFRLRNLGSGVLANIDVHDNWFSARTGQGFVLEAIGARVDSVPEGSRNIRFIRNRIRAEVDQIGNAGTQYLAKALVIDSCRMTSDVMVFKENRFESNDTGVRLGYTDVSETEVVRRVKFQNNEIRRLSDAIARPFHSLILGYWVVPLHDVAFYGTQFSNGASNEILWSGSGRKQVDIGWQCTVAVVDAAGARIPDAALRVTASGAGILSSGVTDRQGTAVIDVVASRYDGTAKPTSVDFGRLTLQVNRDGYKPAAKPLIPYKDTHIRVPLEPTRP